MPLLTRSSVRAVLLASAAIMPLSPALAQDAATTQQSPAPAATPSNAIDSSTEANGENIQDVVVTGQTTRNRPLITASADITYADRATIDQKAPRSTADLLELVPGIFVEGTAGQISNNYSVRGLQGGSQRFVQLEEDGMPILYGGGGADFFFDNDLTIERLEAVKGGSSGVLTVNGAGATINFISKRPNFDHAEGEARITAYNYGWKRADAYYSQPLGENLAFNVGGYIQSNPGVRENPFNYQGWRIKGSVEYRFDGGGYLRVTAKGGKVNNAYYADQPYAFVNGKPESIPGLDTQFGNVGGDAFADIAVPVSTYAHPSGFRPFRYRDGVVARTAETRIDVDKPLSDRFDLFLHSRILKYSYDFNGLFPGSGTGNAGLTSAENYLTPGASPINDLLAAGLAAYPQTVRFGIKNLRTGVVIGADQLATLNALNGNGFLQRTTLNHDYVSAHDFGLNAGGRWEIDNGGFKNSLTAGVMYYSVRHFQDQSATASVVNDVKTNSDIYDIVSLNANDQVIGTLSDNGLVSYGDWGAGIRVRNDDSTSLYANDELTLGKFHIDGGIRWESDDALALDGNTPTAANAAARIVQVSPGNYQQLVQPGVVGVIPTVGSTYDGTYARRSRTRSKAAYTVGVNYEFAPNFAIYGRYALGFQTNNVDPITTIELYEAGVRYQAGRFFTGQATVFHTAFDNQNYNASDPNNPAVQVNYNADLRTKGIEIDFTLRPVRVFSVDFEGVFQDPKLVDLQFNGATQAGYSGKRPERTPAKLFTITPAFNFPNGKGQIYGRYKYIGRIFADNGNGIALPSYGVTSAGISYNLNEHLTATFDADNIFNVVGLTEGNPRQGQTQAITNGYFYARGIVGTTYGGTVTFKF